MNSEEMFACCARRRRALAELIVSLTDDDLATPSLCAGWSVRTVAGHLVMPLVTPAWRVAVTVARRRGNFNAANDQLAREVAAQPVQWLADALLEHAESRFTPPLHGPGAPLTDLCVHTTDIRAVLGRPVDITPTEADAVLDFLHGFSMFFLPRGRLRGIRLAPDDLDRSWGDGVDLTGPASAMVLAVLGRRGFIDELDGPGRALLDTRG